MHVGFQRGNRRDGFLPLFLFFLSIFSIKIIGDQVVRLSDGAQRRREKGEKDQMGTTVLIIRNFSSKLNIS